MKKYLIHSCTEIFLLAILLNLSLNTLAGCLDNSRLTGINLSGAEFNSNKLPGVIDKDYVYPKTSELAFIKAQGGNVIRLPFRWERLQPQIKGELNTTELNRLLSTVAAAKAKDLCVILDVHNYAKYTEQPLASNQLLQDGFVDLWVRIAAAFPDATATVFDLMNEPNYMPVPEWASLAKRTLAAMRAKGSTQIILVAGGHWSGIHDWFSLTDGQSNASQFQDLKDPLNRAIIEVHQYADSNYSGTGSDCKAANQFSDMFTKLTSWAKDHNQRLFLGEFGTAATSDCLLTLEQFLKLMPTDIWYGWTYWASGSWWGGYPLALNTSLSAPSAQWSILKKYFFVAGAINPPKPPTPISIDTH